MSRKPTYNELRSREVYERMEAHRHSVESDARRYGIPFDSTIDIFELAKKVHAARDDEEWPVLAEYARSLGVPIYFGFGICKRRRTNAEVSIDCDREEERRRLLKKYKEED